MKPTIIAILICLLLIPILVAQDVDPIPITLDETLTIELNADNAVILEYTAEESQYVTIVTRTAPDDENAPDTILEILTQDFVHIAYADDLIFEESVQRDAQIADLLLPEAGTYYIRIDSFNGVSEGEVEVTISIADKFTPATIEEDTTTQITLRLPPSKVFDYSLSVEAGDLLMITAHDLSGMIDPVLLLLDEDGNILAQNDDHGTDDLTLDTFDAQISDFAIESDGVLTVQVYDFLGREGSVELTIIQETPESTP